MKDSQVKKIEYLYKYATVPTAKKILLNKNFRWSSPIRFNDPFDSQIEIRYNYDINLMLDYAINKLILLAASSKEFHYQDFGDNLYPVEMIRELIKKTGSVNPKIREKIKPIFQEAFTTVEKALVDYNKKWTENVKKLRVFCLSADYTNILMWSHYTNNHRGVVMKLKILPKEHNKICAAKPINYRKIPFKLFSADEVVDQFLKIKKVDGNKILRDYILTKYRIWEYEKEWRVWEAEDDETNLLYSDYKIIPNEIVSIYFGCNAEEKNIKEIQKLSLDINSEITFYKAIRVLGKYELRFDKLEK